MKKQFTAFFIGIFICTGLAGAHQDMLSPDELPEKYRVWLEEEVMYIITPVEREVFLQLKTDRERDMFIEAFWKHRDDTPGTPENEFKQEHYRRLRYVEQWYGRGTSSAGWATDRGRMYIILGEPRTIERYENETEIYPTIVWFYQGMSKYGLPNAFNLIFLKKYGSGDYELYSPIKDGPQKMLVNYFGDPKDYLEAFNQLRLVQPELANTSMTLLPQEPISGQNPSMASEMLLANILVKPQKSIKDQYARKLLKYKDIIEVEYSTNFIGNDAMVALIYNDRKVPYIHYLIEPENLSVNAMDGTYYTTLEVSGQVTDQDNRSIYQFSRTLPIRFGEDQMKKIGSRPFSYQNVFPLCPGEYHFHLLVKNRLSKEFTSFERDIVVPESGLSPVMSSLVLAPSIRENASVSGEKAFLAGEVQLYPSPARRFTINDSLHVMCQLPDINLPEIKEGNITFVITKGGEEEVLRETKPLSSYPRTGIILEAFPLKDLKPAHYVLDVNVYSSSDEKIFSNFQHFSISNAEIIPRQFIYSEPAPAFNDPETDFILGGQYFNKDDLEKAQDHLQRAYHSRPESLTYALGLSRLLYAQEDYQAGRRILEPFAERETENVRFLKFLGDISRKLGRYLEAVSFYRRYIEGEGLTIDALNALGTCYYRLDNPQEALAAWEKSLEMNPEQDEIKKMVEFLKEEK
ncbi:MAG: GWxTD domain-containing protein [Candidatus Aminicenantes bacterium]